MAKEGEYTRDGYLLAIDTINSAGGIRVGDKHYRVALQYYDDQSHPARVPPLYRKLLTEDHVNFLLGPYTSALTAAAAPVAEAARVPMVDAHGSAESIFTPGTAITSASSARPRNYLRGVIAVVHAQRPRGAHGRPARGRRAVLPRGAGRGRGICARTWA